MTKKKKKGSKKIGQKKNLDSFDDYEEDEIQSPIKNMDKKNLGSEDIFEGEPKF